MNADNHGSKCKILRQVRLSTSTTDNNVYRRYCLYAQGCPLLIVLVTFAVDSAAKARDDYDTMDIRSTLCFYILDINCLSAMEQAAAQHGAVPLLPGPGGDLRPQLLHPPSVHLLPILPDHHPDCQHLLPHHHIHPDEVGYLVQLLYIYPIRY